MLGELKVVNTNDGSPTLFVPHLNEHYHSIHGAFTEAMHVFYKNGLELISGKNEINVFEMGFGTGLNALVAFYFSKVNNKTIYYESIEKYPVPNSILNQISYSDFFNGLNLLENEKKLQLAAWNVAEDITDKFQLKKVNAEIENYIPQALFFDIVFYDAFGPRAQNEVWQINNLSKMYDALKHEGVLVTYCANGQMKRNLRGIGFKVKALPGPPGKREMTVAVKEVL